MSLDNKSALDPNYQFMPVLRFEKTHPDAKLPVKNHETDTGYDVYSVENKIIPSKGSGVVGVGLKFAEIPEGYWVKVESRSGLGFKHGILAHPGIIDNGYRGDAGVKLYNLSDADYEIKAGDRVAQFVVYMNIAMNIEWGQVQATARGEKGFGSSGK
ncbi:MAG: dUTP diphosphatase [Proteobacteria bacterium]|nr:dUTP diphosphatase [Pseudomonadota bacterium]NBP15064.1 dUTP diphosphatase [bacterium]